ncbi:MAG TPA: Hsp20/alpha crystallin family protein [Candidatus Aciduliprofundum boonei]|uniref:Hsp20/alpha crystallin family protein n=1 Tax=Candidatus Aciduliprofundum boonei TaxID=379547 RepID=A0A7J3T9E8_9ARCH|nr:Hsp20/alpha crystallin family protein [Candidatus Aciduliprofundum boonei]
MVFGDRVFKEMHDMMTQMEREFDAMRREFTQDYKMPVMDIYETDEEVVIKAEMPGVRKEDIVLNVSPNSIEIQAELSEEKEENVRGYYKKERVLKRYYRTVSLPAKVSTDDIKAKFENGILVIRMKKEKGEKKRVSIE